MDQRNRRTIHGKDFYGEGAISYTPEQLLLTLESLVNKSINLKLNNNKSTYLSLSYGVGGQMNLSLHRIFLKAPSSVIEALAIYLKGSKNKYSFSLIKAFVNEQDSLCSKTTNKKIPPICTKGRVYDLKYLYEKVCQSYFKNVSLPLHITWYTPKRKKAHRRPYYRQRVTFGEYHASQNLIKINQLIDHWQVPSIFVMFIIYHEILHFLFPPIITPKGYSQVHHKTFKEEEKKFLFYHEVEHWRQFHMESFLDKNHC